MNSTKTLWGVKSKTKMNRWEVEGVEGVGKVEVVVQSTTTRGVEEVAGGVEGQAH